MTCILKRIFLITVNFTPSDMNLKKNYNDKSKEWANVEILETIIVVKVINNLIRYVGDSKSILYSYLIALNIIHAPFIKL